MENMDVEAYKTNRKTALDKWRNVVEKIRAIKKEFPNYAYSEIHNPTLKYVFNDANIPHLNDHLEKAIDNYENNFAHAPIKIQRAERLIEHVEKNLEDIKQAAFLSATPSTVNQLDIHMKEYFSEEDLPAF